MISAGEQRTALYRFYDADERLLYVGITNDPWRRWRQHVLEKSWYPQVKHQAVTWYDNRTAAEVAEYVAIRCEYPRFNIAGAVRPVPDEAPAESTSQLVPESEPEPEAEVTPTEPPGPKRNRRTLLVILICIFWAFLPSTPGLPSWRNPYMMALVGSTIIPVLAYLLICAAPGIHRFGRWLDCTFTPDGNGL